MEIRTFKVENYKGCNIYYRNFENIFEYLVVVNGKLSTKHVPVKPHFVTNLLYLLGIEKTRYSDQQTKNIIKALRRLSMTTIDVALGDK